MNMFKNSFICQKIKLFIPGRIMNTGQKDAV
jgi:hypothetical protein